MKRITNTQKDTHIPSAESGSVLFYILIAVALFAALSYAVSQTNRGGSTKNDELLQLQASEILQYTNGLQRVIRAMRIEGVEYDELSFENNTVGGYTNFGCGSDSCKVFHVSGGGMAYQVPLVEDWLDSANSAETFFGEWYFPGELCALDVGSDTGNACSSDDIDNEDVIVILPWIKQDLCVKINEELGIGDAIPQETSLNAWNGDNRHFTGDVGNGERLDQGGRRIGCFEGNGANTTPPANSFHFFHVLWAR